VLSLSTVPKPGFRQPRELPDLCRWNADDMAFGSALDTMISLVWNSLD
jgi:hypothetical protein